MGQSAFSTPSILLSRTHRSLRICITRCMFWNWKTFTYSQTCKQQHTLCVFFLGEIRMHFNTFYTLSRKKVNHVYIVISLANNARF